MMGVAATAAVDNEGVEFYLGYMPNWTGSQNVEIHLTGETATTVTVEYPQGTVLSTESVTPGTVTIVTLPVAASNNWTPDTVAANMVRVTADDEFVAYMVNRTLFTSDAALALPVDVHNTEYIVTDYDPAFIGGQFLVYAAYDDTTVTITPSTNLVGRPAGVPFDVILQQGEGYYALSATTSSTNSLTGTIVSADRPVGMTNGNGCTQVPNGTAFCDHIFEVAQPVQTWGTEIGVANLPQRPSGSIYRIVASENATTVTLDGAPLVTLNRGQYHEIAPLAGNHVFRADKPIYVSQFMTGSTSPDAVQGDPAQGNMIPFAQYVNDYTFSTVGGGQFVDHYVTIIADNADVGVLTLDGVVVPAAEYTAIPATSYSAAVIALSEGTHSTSSPNPHGITVEGYNQDDSYLYPGGALFQFINPVGDANPPLVSLDPQAGDPPTVDGTATDDRPSEDTNGNDVLDPGEDLNGNDQIDEDTGIFFVELGPGSANLTLSVDPFVPGDGSATFQVGLIDPSLDGSGSVVVTDGAGNTTEVPVEITANTAPTVEITQPVDGSTVEVGQLVELSATITDPDVGDTHTCSIDWGDGTVDPGVVVGDLCTGSHTYSSIATPTIEVTVTDDGGLTGTDDVMLIVIDPETKVTGGGWLLDDDGERVRLGFVAKPGEGQIQVRGPGFRFHGNTVADLVAVKPTASWSGTGRYNNVDGYSFEITVNDTGNGRSKRGTPDSLSLVIRDGDGNTVYEVSGTIGGGNLKVH